MTPDRIPHMETKLDALSAELHTMHVSIINQIRDTVDDALDRHTAHCPMGPRIDALERHGSLDCPLTPRVEALEEARGKSTWDRWGPWALIVGGFALGALIVSGVISAEALAAIFPF
jgi:hypothetical protein